MAGGIRLSTPQVTTGSYSTVDDPYNVNLPNDGAQNTPGAYYEDVDSKGRPQVHRYVRFNPTASGTPIVGPVYWKDETHTVVTPTMSESQTGKANSIAGCLLNPNIVAGDWCWIKTSGYLSAMVVAASCAADDILIGAAGYELTARVAAGTAPTNRPLGIVQTAISSGASDVYICVEDF